MIAAAVASFSFAAGLRCRMGLRAENVRADADAEGPGSCRFSKMTVNLSGAIVTPRFSSKRRSEMIPRCNFLRLASSVTPLAAAIRWSGCFSR